MRKHSPVDIINDFKSAERALKSGIRLSPQKVAQLIETCTGPMPKVLREYTAGLLRSKSLLPVGRKAMDDAKWDFIIADAKEYYARKLASGMRSEDAIEETRQKYGKEYGISGKRLLNLFSESKRCEVPESDEIPPDHRDPPDHVPETLRIPLRQQWIC